MGLLLETLSPANPKDPQDSTRQLYITDATVKTHITHILQKLNLRDRVQAVVLAHQTGVFARDSQPASGDERPID